MSKLTNDGLTQSGTGCFIAVPIWQQWASKGQGNTHEAHHSRQSKGDSVRPEGPYESSLTVVVELVICLRTLDAVKHIIYTLRILLYDWQKVSPVYR